MWRIFFFSIVLQCIFSYDAEAQLYVGPTIGGEVSKVYFFDGYRYNDFTPRPSFGFSGGFMASMRIHKNYVLNAQLLYSTRTKHIDPGAGYDPEFKFTSKMQFIELPIFYALEFKSLKGDLNGRGGKIKTYNWFAGAGPIVSYWLSGKSTMQSSNLREIHIDQIDYTTIFGADPSSGGQPITSNKEYVSEANRFQFGINFTGGLSFEPVGLHKIVTFVQFNFMQTFLAKSDVSLPTFDIDVLRARNHSIRLSVAYLLDTKIETSKKGKSTKGKEVKRKRR